VKIEQLPEDMQEDIRESDSPFLRFERYIPRSERYYFGLIPKPKEIFSDPPTEVQDIWVCVEHEYCTTSVTRLFIHGLRHHRGGML